MINYQKPEEKLSISFGNGGGFTGAIDEYILQEDGQLHKVELTKTGADTLLIKKLKRKEVSVFFQKMTDDSLTLIELNEVGNITYFISLVKGKELVKSFHWKDGSDVPSDIQILYNRLMELIKT